MPESVAILVGDNLFACAWQCLECADPEVKCELTERLEQAGDGSTVAVLEIILRDEIGHVETGTRWFRFLCNERDLDPDVTFAGLVQEYMRGQVKRPFHYAAREKAGFSKVEMGYLEAFATRNRVTHEK